MDYTRRDALVALALAAVLLRQRQGWKSVVSTTAFDAALEDASHGLLDFDITSYEDAPQVLEIELRKTSAQMESEPALPPVHISAEDRRVARSLGISLD